MARGEVTMSVNVDISVGGAALPAKWRLTALGWIARLLRVPLTLTAERPAPPIAAREVLRVLQAEARMRFGRRRTLERARMSGKASPDLLCGKGTMHGRAAMLSKHGFAPCVLDRGHTGRCDSGDAPKPEPDRFDGRKAA